MGIHACPLSNEADVLKENLIESFQIYVDIESLMALVLPFITKVWFFCNESSKITPTLSMFYCFKFLIPFLDGFRQFC